MLPDFPRYLPQDIEVPPNVEAARIIPYVSVVPSKSSNHLLLKDELEIPIFIRLLAGLLLSVRSNDGNGGKKWE
jgi:hypothetical protein